MSKIVNLRFREAGQLTKYLCDGYNLKIGDMVMADTPMGLDLGHVVESPYELSDELLKEDITPVRRLATDAEIERYSLKQEKENEAFERCLSLIEKHNLDMNLIDAVFSFDGKKVVFFFTSDNRVDFRELVKDLVQSFRARIELRQIGSRDQAKLVGGIGMCGRELCCCTFLEHFAPVTLRMARDQGVSLNPSKLNGACGRLMCCLQFEKDAYADAKRRLPKVGRRVRTPDGVGVVTAVDLVTEKVTVSFTKDDTSEILHYIWEGLAPLNPDIGTEKPAAAADKSGCPHAENCPSSDCRSNCDSSEPDEANVSAVNDSHRSRKSRRNHGTPKDAE